MNYKNRRPKRFKGCCGMCACRDHAGGVRNKRVLTPQEQRAEVGEPVEFDLQQQRYDAACAAMPADADIGDCDDALAWLV